MGHSTSKLRPKELTDLQINTHFSEKELHDWYKNFRQDYPSGHLTIDNFTTIYSNCFPEGDGEDFAAQAFRTFDANGDGVINFREFMCALSVKSRGRSDQKLRWAFRMYDIDSNGYVSREEMIEIIQAIYKMVGNGDKSAAEERTDKIFDTMDKNADGQLSQEEFIEGARNDPTIVQMIA
ncbi:neurocalcin homolog [Mizuhopecten yessoensis]|uniref:Neurocalcin-like n=1 Tax=Mizuhopecten yessoensis TaxID=6573 RepID=A0A210QL37_MIZYE|nr:neurocalcin homolog [Mizuhopecten yessoensis]XP_021355644.1 neurocalcin homolog [Mizuhopecten yessoensis]XP_021355645.1 neurocalcin homolog [Mizuhopecten yessoensis]OWF49458.1 Neurocalcin-like [Mizuhopecten yessoensis]